jgi:type IV pilus assembly protein PilB
MNQYEFATEAAKAFRLRLLDIKQVSFDHLPYQHIHEKLRKTQALPLYQRGHKLYIAVSDPLNLESIKQYRFQTGLDTEMILVPDKDLRDTIDQVLQKRASQSLAEFDASLEEVNLDVVNEKEQQFEPQTEASELEAPVVKFVNKIILDAIQQGASDIHFEPYEKNYRVRFRLDGILKEVASPPKSLAPKLTSRLKIMSNMDIAEKRLPQDGRFKMQIAKTSSIEFRVASCPSLYGEKVVMRILDPSKAQIDIDQLGYQPKQKEKFINALYQSQGMILVTGPTGSGKTVSLYTGLNMLNTPDQNISTVEDPVEINLPGINQVTINNKAGLTFASALKAFMRQDPDIIMVGEIRDLETAETAVKASQTGHLVLSTLHTNNASETIARLMNMGVANYNIAASVHLIIAQRLARRLCPYCKKEESVPDESLLQLGFTQKQINQKPVLYQPEGCRHCTDGYKGRVGIFEVLPISEKMKMLILNNAKSTEIAEQAQKENIHNLRQAGIEKVIQGVTSLAEINRVT